MNLIFSLSFYPWVHDLERHSQLIKVVFWLFWRYVIAIKIVTVTMAGLPRTVRLKDTEEVWTVDLRTTASSIEENECDRSVVYVRNWASLYLPLTSHIS